MSSNKKLENIKFLGIIFLTIFSLVFGLSCNRAVGSKGSSKAAVVSIGKLTGNYAKCSLEIDISVDGVNSVFTGNANLVKKVYQAGQTAVVGVKSIEKCNGKKLYTEKNNSSSKCPYVSRILSAGVNHVNVNLCVEGSEDIQGTTPDPDPNKDPDPKKDPEKEGDNTNIDIITTIEDNNLDLPPEVSIQISPTIND